jgi:DNA-binding response OmpR family regulator
VVGWGEDKEFSMKTKPLILVADDDPDILKLVNRRLAKRGYEVLTAPDGQQALELVRSHRPAAAVLDWLMPVMQGHEVCSQLKADQSTADIPVVLLTARAADVDIEKGFRWGADDYLTKPFDLWELDLTLKRLIANALR